MTQHNPMPLNQKPSWQAKAFELKTSTAAHHSKPHNPSALRLYARYNSLQARARCKPTEP